MEPGRELRRKPTLSHQQSLADTSHLRGLLKVNHDDDDEGGDGSAPATAPHGETRSLATVIKKEKREMPTSPTLSAVKERTLLDIIRHEKDPHGVLMGGSNGSSHHISWKTFKDRLRLRRAGAVWNSLSSGSSPSPSGAVMPGSPRPSASLARPPTLTSVMSKKNFSAAPTEEQGYKPFQQQKQEDPEPVRVSLMALLEQSDMMGDSEDEDVADGDAEAGEDEEEGDGAMEYTCCVCLVRHKNTMFVQCGHTFCRLCSRELWVSSGNCPLCNDFVIEILHTF